ncbi:MAG: TlpA family protein disulfide reductase [Chloroflexi bacterium]|nr:TlpA family protein disulfide reductase [Chloroflexota bacterium]
MIGTLTPRRAATGVAWLGVAALLIVLVAGLVRQSRPPVASIRTDRIAPGFALTTFDGQPLSLASLAGRPVVVNFWASWCVPCREEAPALERVWQESRDRGVVFVGIDIQDTEPAARAFLREFRPSYPNAPDPRGEVAIDYGVVGIPETFFINREGRIIRKYVGPLSETSLRAFVQEIAR